MAGAVIPVLQHGGQVEGGVGVARFHKKNKPALGKAMHKILNFFFFF